jgi:hypothetical protein
MSGVDYVALVRRHSWWLVSGPLGSVEGSRFPSRMREEGRADEEICSDLETSYVASR